VTDIKEFLKLEAAGGIMLVGAAALAMIMANSFLGGTYVAILEIPVAVQVGALVIAKPLLLWINDGLMAVFFFLIGLEVKREVLQGELSSVAVGMGAAPAAMSRRSQAAFRREEFIPQPSTLFWRFGGLFARRHTVLRCIPSSIPGIVYFTNPGIAGKVCSCMSNSFAMRSARNRSSRSGMTHVNGPSSPIFLG